MASLDLLEHYKLSTHTLTSTSTIHLFNNPDPARRRRRVEVKQEWSRVRRLGIGGYGVVYLEKEVEKGELRAVKRVTKSMNEKDELESLRELISITIFSKDNTNFPTFYGWFDDAENIYIAMEYFEHGDLYQCLSSGKQPLPERQAQSICFQIAEALEVIHERSITHRDLKPNNVFVVRKGPHWLVKLGDFGIAKRVQNQDTSLHTVYIGTYVAPEILGLVSVDPEMPTPYTSAVDIWSLGCLTYWVLTLQVLFEPSVLRPYCLEGKLPESLRQSSSITDKALDFIRQCVALDSKKRPTATAALEMPWLEEEHSEDGNEHEGPEDKYESRELGENMAPGPQESLPNDLNQPQASRDVGQVVTGSATPFSELSQEYKRLNLGNQTNSNQNGAMRIEREAEKTEIKSSPHRKMPGISPASTDTDANDDSDMVEEPDDGYQMWNFVSPEEGSNIRDLMATEKQEGEPGVSEFKENARTGNLKHSELVTKLITNEADPWLAKFSRAERWRDVEGRVYLALYDHNMPHNEYYDPRLISIASNESFIVLGEGTDDRLVVRRYGDVGFVPRDITLSPCWDFGNKNLARVEKRSGRFIRVRNVGGETKHVLVSSLNPNSVRWVARWLGMRMGALRDIGATYDHYTNRLMPANCEWKSFRSAHKPKPTARFHTYRNEMVTITSADGKKRTYPIEWITSESLELNLFDEFLKLPEMLLQKEFVLAPIASEDCSFGKALGDWRRDDTEALLLTAGTILCGFTESHIITKTTTFSLWELKYRDLQIVAAALNNLRAKVKTFQTATSNPERFGKRVKWQSSSGSAGTEIWGRVVDVWPNEIWYESSYYVKSISIAAAQPYFLRGIVTRVNPEKQRILNPFRKWDLSGIPPFIYKRTATDLIQSGSPSGSTLNTATTI